MKKTTSRKFRLGRHEEGELFLSPKQRAEHVFVVGASGSGKTNALECMLRQDIRAGRGFMLIDPMGALYDSALAYCAEIGRTDIVLFDPGDPDWVVPFDPLDREGELSLSVDRFVQATLTAWGQVSSDEMPRFEKWLRVLTTMAGQAGLSVAEIEMLMEPKSQLRERLMPYVADETIRRTLGFLDTMSMRDFLTQMESTHSRLLRFSGDTAVGRSVGLGKNAIDFGKLMDGRGGLLVNLSAQHLSRQQQKLFGATLVNKAYHHAMRRETGATPFYAYLDEAPLYAPAALGESLEHCRQKGLHVTFAAQRLSQFVRERNEELYHAVKSGTGTKIVFRLRDRATSTDLTDDIFPGLAKPRIKHEEWSTAYELEDVVVPTRTVVRGTTASWSESEARGLQAGTSSAKARGKSYGDIDHTSTGLSRRIDDGTLTETSGVMAGYSGGTSEVTTLTKTGGVSITRGHQRGGGTSETESISYGLYTRHRAYRKRDSVLFLSLDEQRWLAAEAMMLTPTGRAYAKVGTRSPVLIEFPMPKRSPISTGERAAYTVSLLKGYALPRNEAERIIGDRRREILKRGKDGDDLWHRPRRS